MWGMSDLLEVVLTPDDQLDWGGSEGILRGEVGRGHLALPLAVVELDGCASHPYAAVTAGRGHRAPGAHGGPATDPLVFARIHPDGLKQNAIICLISVQ